MRKRHTMGRHGLGRWMAIAFVAFALLLLCSGTALAAGPNVLTVHVTDAANPNPLTNGIPNAHVDFMDPSNNTPLFGESTDPSGTWTYEGVPSGTYKVQVTDSSHTYIAEWYGNVPAQTDVFVQTDPSGTTAGRVTVGAGDNTINIALTRGYSIRGRVTDASIHDPNKSGIAGVPVGIFDESGNNLMSVGDSTDGKGNYQSFALIPGSYKVATTNINDNGEICHYYVDQWYGGLECQKDSQGNTATLVDASATEAQNVSFALTLGCVISGTVKDVADQPIGGVWVQALDTDGNPVGLGSTNATTGYYSSGGVLSGDYKVETQAMPQNYVDQWYETTGPTPVQNDPDGRHVTPIALTLAGATADFVLGLGFSISGEVLDPSSEPMADAQVEVFDASGNRVGSFGAAPDSPPGSYSTPALIPASYRLRATVDDPMYVDEWFLNLSNDPLGRTVDVSEGPATIDIAMAPQHFYSISGYVSDAVTHEPISNVLVEAISSTLRGCPSQDFTDETGHYTLGMLVPSLSAGYVRTAVGDPNVDQWYDGVSVLDNPDAIGAKPVPITDHNVPEINFALHPNTPTGPGTPITFPMTTDPLAPPIFATVDFETVSTAGLTSVVPMGSPPMGSPPLAEFDLNGGYYDVKTSCVYTGSIVLSFPYDTAQLPDPSLVKVLHLDNGVWVDVTEKVENGLVYARVTSLSPFAIVGSSASANTELHDLGTLINGSAAGVDPVMGKSLTADVNTALAALSKGSKNGSKVAINNMNALIMHVKAQTGKKISADAAKTIVDLANAVIAALNQ